RQEVLAQLQQLLGRSETLRDFLLQELEAWRERQQRACMGAPADTCLRALETWFTELGQGLFQLLQLLRALRELQLQLTYERDPLKDETPLLERRLKELLTFLLQRAFVVEQQPSMPNACKRPLVLRTTTKFSVRARLLVRLHDLNHDMEAKIHIDSLSLPPRFRKFNILTSSSKTLLPGESPQEGLICDFQYLVGTPAHSPPPPGPHPLVPIPWSLSLSHLLSAVASLFLGSSPTPSTGSHPWSLLPPHSPLPVLPPPLSFPQEQQFFSVPPPAPWSRLAEVLSWQFESVAERGLSGEHLLMLAEKLFGEA
ncbi:STAT2 protein, partial [Centropus bengalensis]|nr:STAT2 protein [Centropus bengalensis]